MRRFSGWFRCVAVVCSSFHAGSLHGKFQLVLSSHVSRLCAPSNNLSWMLSLSRTFLYRCWCPFHGCGCSSPFPCSCHSVLAFALAVLLLHDWLSERSAFTSNGGGPPAIDRRACRSSVATFLIVTHYTSSIVVGRYHEDVATGNRTQIWRCAVVETPTHHGVDRAVIWKLLVPTAPSARARGDRECTVGGQRWMTRTCARLVKAWWSHGAKTTGGERLVQQTVASPDEGSAVEPKSGAGSATAGPFSSQSQIAPASPTTSGTQQEVAVEEGRPRPEEAKRVSVEGDRDEPNDTMDDVDNAPDPTPKRPRGPPSTRVFPDPRSEEFTPGSSGRLGTSCRHSKRCHERRVIPNPRQASTNSRRSSTTAL